MGLFESKTEKLIQDSLNRAKAANNARRKANAIEVWDINKGDQLAYLDNKLQNQFTKIYKNLEPYITVGTNAIRFISTQNSMVYKEEPTRTIDDENTNELYRQWIEDNQIDIKLNTANQMTFLQKTTHIWLKWDAQTEQVKMSLINQGITDVVQDPMDVTEAYAICFEINSVDTLESNDPRVFYYVDDENQFMFDANGNNLNAKFGIDEINPYKRKPFIKCDLNYNPDEYFSTVDDRLLSFQEAVDKRATWDEVMLYFQAMSQPYLTNYQGKTKDLKASPFDPIIFNSDSEGITGEIDFATPNPKMMESWNICKEKLAQFANEYNIDPMALRTGGDIPSGEALKVMAQRLIEERTRQMKYWRVYEKEMFYLWALIMNTHGKSVNADADFSITFGSVGMDETIEELDLRYQLESRESLTNAVQRYREYHSEQNLTDEEIETILVENSNANRTLNNKFARPNVRDI